MKDEKKRGRPRGFDAKAALAKARDVFWDRGFTAASLDNLSAATKLNRPSLYGAFGDKEDLYLDTLEGYRQDGMDALAEALDPSLQLRDNLARVYAGALAVYLHGETAARGCLLIGTATVEAVEHERVREVLGRSLSDFDGEIEKRMRLAVQSGELPQGADPQMLAMLASAVMHSLAVRARAGDSRETLEAIASSGVELICGSVQRS
ncbi:MULTISPECIES: TetR/AcrR family transcriptional regulator [unclassified Rhizobium]|uniref:TetR/AcrR family transcriptional regulator n=1 Tax=unclassified Rhizobium TaxID=2613769 RepID=UPI001A9904DD|nr:MULTISPECIES: TetR/AcrR family transcriptional regulator [unclassified Rhizobium]MBX5157146.1 TetR/AcrR family transcriptional regulator [Rhizobium sp. NZLR8]MBX5165095.1 TetR/AcrR family transcriptional regulator [Rhizobium sp. NZLR4b]MBX5169134.1 TetR/AcrR family transcriptional regulator [Rhizobium sp. NZLR1b]MBX5185233.1 TetR/AcrR family transcriptional regulator [Rhizobium sp. NZLR5]MBX5189072.1 TetR/AcrR family transcriptional regulator [Rhizobium sp. NZLR3b]